MGTTILPGVEIGPNAIVGAGSIVTKKVPPDTVYAGNPAKFICTLDEYKEKCLQNQEEYDPEEYRVNKQKVIGDILKNRMKL